MDPVFRPIHKEAVMCTVQGCTHVAAFIVTGDTDRNGRRVVAAYCDPHAEKMATRLGRPWPIPERRPAELTVRPRVFRAG